MHEIRLGRYDSDKHEGQYQCLVQALFVLGEGGKAESRVATLKLGKYRFGHILGTHMYIIIIKRTPCTLIIITYFCALYSAHWWC